MSGRIIEASSRKMKVGSLPARLSGNCIRFIQNMIANVVSVSISFLVMVAVIANSSAPNTTSSAAG